jgi:hypothetical protein
MGVSHISINLCLRCKGGNGINNDDVNSAGTYKGFSNLKGLFSGVGLRNPEFINIDPKVPGIHRVKGMFRVDKK